MKALTLIFIFFPLVFIHAQPNTAEKETAEIIGTWVIENESSNKWVFSANQSCEWRFNGVTIGQFTYSVNSEFSPNGNEHTYLKLVGNDNVNEVYEYAINSLGKHKMTLSTLSPKVNYTHFVKQSH